MSTAAPPDAESRITAAAAARHLGLQPQAMRQMARTGWLTSKHWPFFEARVPPSEAHTPAASWDNAPAPEAPHRDQAPVRLAPRREAHQHRLIEKG